MFGVLDAFTVFAVLIAVAVIGIVSLGQLPGRLAGAPKAACGALRIGTVQYEQGATDFTTVLTAEQNLFQAESNVATASANVALGATAIYRALGGGWQIREDSYFVTAATREQMRARTNWGELLPPAGQPQPPAPGLPSSADVEPTVRPPVW
ncbi:TolC family protein [Bradyrhizobium sp. UFLA05-109]